MKCKLITTVSDVNHPGFAMFVKSLEKFNWDWEVCDTEYHAFGSKMVNAYNFALQTDCTHLFIADAYDVVVLSDMAEALDKIYDKNSILLNAERNAWPFEQWALLYPEVKSSWKYLNGGVAFVEVKKFIEMFEENPIQHSDNDQVNLAKVYLTNRDKYNMQLDTNCNVFQTLCGTTWDDFTFEGDRVINRETGTKPVFFHFNGLHPADKIWELV